MRWKLACFAIVALLLGALGVFWFVLDTLPLRRPDVIALSPSRQFIVERVSVKGLLTAEDVSYLRITDQDAPGKIKRSPLYPTKMLAMNVDETPEEVVVGKVHFNIKGKFFVLENDTWSNNWLSRFILSSPSNAVSPGEAEK
ncbi:hypothetical protein ACYZT2_00530 [Pseudomonas sp. MDT1-85]